MFVYTKLIQWFGITVLQ